MHQHAPEHQPEVQPKFPDKHTEARQPRRSTRSNLGQRFPTYAQEYDLITTVLRYIMSTNMRISRITEKYSRAKVSDPDNMYFHQAMKKNDATKF